MFTEHFSMIKRRNLVDLAKHSLNAKAEYAQVWDREISLFSLAI